MKKKLALSIARESYAFANLTSRDRSRINGSRSRRVGSSGTRILRVIHGRDARATFKIGAPPTRVSLFQGLHVADQRFCLVRCEASFFERRHVGWLLRLFPFEVRTNGAARQ